MPAQHLRTCNPDRSPSLRSSPTNQPRMDSDKIETGSNDFASQNPAKPCRNLPKLAKTCENCAPSAHDLPQNTGDHHRNAPEAFFTIHRPADQTIFNPNSGFRTSRSGIARARTASHQSAQNRTKVAQNRTKSNNFASQNPRKLAKTCQKPVKTCENCAPSAHDLP